MKIFNNVNDLTKYVIISDWIVSLVNIVLSGHSHISRADCVVQWAMALSEVFLILGLPYIKIPHSSLLKESKENDKPIHFGTHTAEEIAKRWCSTPFDCLRVYILDLCWKYSFIWIYPQGSECFNSESNCYWHENWNQCVESKFWQILFGSCQTNLLEKYMNPYFWSILVSQLSTYISFSICIVHSGCSWSWLSIISWSF